MMPIESQDYSRQMAVPADDWWAQNMPAETAAAAPMAPAMNGTGPGSNGNYQLAPDGTAPLMQNWTTQFQPRDPNQIAGDPSFQFQMQQGTQALERSAAAKGTLLTGGALKSLARFGQGLASTFDDKYYNRDLGQYQMAHDIFNQNQTGQFNRLSTLAGMGQTSAGQLGNTGSSYGANAGNTMTDIGNAQAAGTVGGANAWNSALGQIANNTQYGQAGSSYPPYAGGYPPGGRNPYVMY